jgi:hypothetical protein
MTEESMNYSVPFPRCYAEPNELSLQELGVLIREIKALGLNGNSHRLRVLIQERRRRWRSKWRGNHKQ